MIRNYNSYINECKMFIEVMLHHGQWSGLTRTHIKDWFSNFADYNDEEMHLIYKVLTNVIYFTNEDIVRLLEEGIYNNLFNKLIIKAQIENKFQLSNKALSNIVDDEIKKSIFIPLLDKDKPHESSNYIIRLLVQNKIISDKQVCFCRSLEDCKTLDTKKLIIIDDCLGSGNQFTRFWTKNAKIELENEEVSLREWCCENKIEANYLVLFGYDKSIEKIEREYSDINISCIKKLDETHRVFSNCSYIWDSEEERTAFESLLNRIESERGIPRLGYSELDFLLIMDRTIPNWTLPIFWSEENQWSSLLRRKDSSV